MLKRQLVHESQRRATNNRTVATRLQPAAPTQFVRVLGACSLCTYASGDDSMRKASTRLPEQGTQIAVPCSGPHPRSNQKSIEDLHSDWYSKWGHFSCAAKWPVGKQTIARKIRTGRNSLRESRAFELSFSTPTGYFINNQSAAKGPVVNIVAQ